MFSYIVTLLVQVGKGLWGGKVFEKKNGILYEPGNHSACKEAYLRGRSLGVFLYLVPFFLPLLKRKGVSSIFIELPLLLHRLHVS